MCTYNSNGSLGAPVRVKEEVWENQRWRFRTQKFCPRLLPTDRFPFSNEDGTENRDKKLIELPSHVWRWVGDWEIENTLEGQPLEDGWTYALDFPYHFSPKKDWKSCVRRRKWFRIREYAPSHRWSSATQDEKDSHLIQNYQAANDVDCAWAIGPYGEIYFQECACICQLDGSHWTRIDVTCKSQSKIQIQNQLSVSANGTPFIVQSTGDLLYRVGVTPTHLSGTSWATARGPPGGIFQISVGKDALWAITRDKRIWTLKQKLEEIISVAMSVDEKCLEAFHLFEWQEVPGRMKAVSVNNTDLVVLAIGRDDDVAFYRTHVTEDNLVGKDWKEVSQFYDHRNVDIINYLTQIRESSSSSSPSHKTTFKI